MNSKTSSLYQVREFVGNSYSKQLGRRLRKRVDAGRIVRILEGQGRIVFAARVLVATQDKA